MAYDKSYGALFKPGNSGEFFTELAPQFQPELAEYSHDNAWWLAELCRLVYRIDDQLRILNELGSDIVAVLDRIDIQIKSIVSHDPTSSRAVVFTVNPQQSSSNGSSSLVLFCGSNEVLDWKINLQALQETYDGHAKVHSGFKQCFNILAGQLADLGVFDRPVLLAGHSLGAALASLMAASLSQQNLPLISCYSFGAPRVGNRAFVNRLSRLPLFRLVNNCDIVTSVPFSLGPNEYCQSDNAVFFDASGNVSLGIADTEIQKCQTSYFPTLKKYASLETLISRARSLSEELPVYLADHAIVNYRNRIAIQLEGSS